MTQFAKTVPSWGISSSGRASDLQSEGDRFESDMLHQRFSGTTFRYHLYTEGIAES